ncbi:MAG: hypothetical protein JWO86_2682 [Myxococcaceae bacterium]|nr:hypothetical protein [Myxococcaceae bacterium]
MKRIWGHVVSGVAVALTASAVMPACATNDQSIFIRAALAPSANRQMGGCVYTGDPTQAELFEAHADLGVTDSYFAVLLVGNQLIPRSDSLSNRAESNRVHINGAIVRVTETSGALIREFTSSSVGFADAASNGTPAYTSIGVVALDAPTRDIILPTLTNRVVSKTILINIKAFGTTLGGKDVESGEFQLPMQVCNGCLVDFSTGNDPTQPQPNCLKPTAMAQTAATSPCFRGQDEPVLCQTCIGTRVACDPTKLNPPPVP